MNSAFGITSECHCCCLVKDDCVFSSVTGQDGGLYWELLCPECKEESGLAHERPVIILINIEAEVKRDTPETQAF